MLKDAVHKIPFVRLLSALIPGILFAYLFKLAIVLLCLLLAISVLALFVLSQVKVWHASYQFRWLAGVFIWLVFFCVGYIGFEGHENTIKALSRTQNLYLACIVNEPEVKARSLSLLAEVQNEQIDPCQVIIYVQKDSASEQLSYGDQIIIHCGFDSILASKVPHGFDYAAWLHRRHIVSQAYVGIDQWWYVGQKQEWRLSDVRQMARLHIREVFAEQIDSDAFALIMALMVGEKRGIDQEQKEVFKAAGVLHVLAVSGLHVGILYVFISGMLFALKRNKVLNCLRSVLIWLCLIGFCIIAGLSPSVVRAAGMFILIDLGRLLNKRSSIYNIIAASAFMSLLIDPHTLFEAGFWLSYLAVLSIITFYPFVKALWNPKNKVLIKLRDLLALSLAVQPGTAPLSVYLFYQFPVWFLLSNIVAVPLVGIIINFAMVILLLDAFLLVPGAVFAMLQFLFDVMQGALTFIAELPHAVWKGIAINELGLSLLLLAGLLLAVMLWDRNKKLLMPVLLCFALFLIVQLKQTVVNSSRSELVAFENFNQKGIYLKHGQNGLWIANPDSTSRYDVLAAYRAIRGIDEDERPDSPCFNFRTDFYQYPTHVCLEELDSVALRSIMQVTFQHVNLARFFRDLQDRYIHDQIKMVLIPRPVHNSFTGLLFSENNARLMWIIYNEGINRIDLDRTGPLIMPLYE